MAVCKKCNGLGKIKLMPFGYICTCAECKGTGEIRDYMTNEEWFDTLTTKGKAEVIAQLSSYGGNVEAILDWLKEKHEC